MDEIVRKNIQDEFPSDQYLVIPVGEREVGDFIASLLGQPQSIERETMGEYEIDLAWCHNMYHLIHQRITQQNESKLVDFSFEIGYQSDTIRRINTLNEFLHFNEHRPLTTNSIKIVWTYVVTFPNKPTPEKQQIEIFISKRGPAPRRNQNIFNIIFSAPTLRREGVFSYKIYYTERTWGEDIDHLLSVQTDQILSTSSLLSRIIDISIFNHRNVCSIGGIIGPLHCRKNNSHRPKDNS